MIFFNDKINLTLKDFGILIPLLDSRAKDILSALMKNPVLFKSQNEWFDNNIESWNKVLIEDLKRVHNTEFIDQLFKDPTESLIECYELIDKEGRYNRHKTFETFFQVQQWKGIDHLQLY